MLSQKKVWNANMQTFTFAKMYLVLNFNDFFEHRPQQANKNPPKKIWPRLTSKLKSFYLFAISTIAALFNFED